MRLLLIEDDVQLSEQLKANLKTSGFVVDTTYSGIDGEYLGKQFSYDAIILDLGLPDKNGIEVLRSWRNNKVSTPVIILTARNAWYEKVDGFKAGADDYLGKPFHSEELVARIKALINRSYKNISSKLEIGNFLIDEERQILINGGKEVELTDIEFRLLRYFILNKGLILSKKNIEEHIYDLESNAGSNVIEVYINRLRQKIGKDMIQTRRGQGYILINSK